MKTSLLVSCIFLIASCSGQKKSTAVVQKSANSKEIVLVKVLSDSRCPEKAQCIWAGEVRCMVAAYENGKKIEEKECILSPTTDPLVLDWFQSHLPEYVSKLKEIQILPYPKNGVLVKKEDYTIKFVY